MLKCDPRAFSRCPYNKTCAPIEEAAFTEGSDCDIFNQKVLRTPITNADKIRGMTDRGLAAFLYTTTRACADRTCQTCPIGKTNCIVLLHWLRQEASIASCGVK